MTVAAGIERLGFMPPIEPRRRASIACNRYQPGIPIWGRRRMFDVRSPIPDRYSEDLFVGRGRQSRGALNVSQRSVTRTTTRGASCCTAQPTGPRELPAVEVNPPKYQEPLNTASELRKGSYGTARGFRRAGLVATTRTAGAGRHPHPLPARADVAAGMGALR